MTGVSYNKLVNLKPTIYDTIINQLGQEIVLVEHPTKGDEAEVIAIFHKEKVAAYTGFFDTEDFFTDSDYNPCVENGKFVCHFELA